MVEPSITAIVLTYQQARFVEECLDTLAAQTFSDWELVIADDASTDGAPDVALAWAERHGVPAKLVLHERNRGICATLNGAVDVAEGRYVAIIAADDHWEPEKFERQVAVLDANSDAAVVYSDMAVMDEEAVRDDQRTWRTSGASGHLFEQFLSGTMVGTATALIRRTSLESVGGFDEQLVFEDWDMWLRLAERYEFEFSGYVSAVYRERATSMSHGSEFRREILISSGELLQKWVGRSRREDRLIGEAMSKIGVRLDQLERRSGLRLLWKAFRLAPGRATAVRLARSVLTSISVGRTRST